MLTLTIDECKRFNDMAKKIRAQEEDEWILDDLQHFLYNADLAKYSRVDGSQFPDLYLTQDYYYKVAEEKKEEAKAKRIQDLERLVQNTKCEIKFMQDSLAEFERLLKEAKAE